MLAFATSGGTEFRLGPWTTSPGDRLLAEEPEVRLRTFKNGRRNLNTPRGMLQ